VVIVDSSVLVDYALTRLTGIIDDMRVFPERMMRNIQATNGLVFSQEVMMLLAEKSNLPREEAHTLVRDIALACWENGEDFLGALFKNETVKSCVSEDELHSCFNLETKIRYVDHIFNKVFGE
jgi:adenylosuccinate lyase